jgi:pimeloyl-ACP methyl ester carboxylesterase
VTGEASEFDVAVAEAVSLRVRRFEGDRPPFLLVHGLASNKYLWDGVAAALAAQGHAVTAVDLRGHGRSSKPDSGYDPATVANDLRDLIAALGDERPVVAGQSWGGNLVLELAHRDPGLVRGIVCIDGGWIELSDRFTAWGDCCAALTPPDLIGVPADEMARMIGAAHPSWPPLGIAGALANFETRPDGTVAPWLTLDRHLRALHGLWDHHPSRLYPGVAVPVLLVPADDGSPWSASKRDEVARAERSLVRARTVWFTADHDVHAQHPDAVAELLVGAVDDGFFA